MPIHSSYSGIHTHTETNTDVQTYIHIHTKVDRSLLNSEWQIKIGTNTVNILIVYRPPYSQGNPYTGFKFVEEFGDFLGDRLNNTNIIMGDFNFHVEDVKDYENLAFQDLLQSFGLIQHVGCPTHQSGHTLGNHY